MIPRKLLMTDCGIIFEYCEETGKIMFYASIISPDRDVTYNPETGTVEYRGLPMGSVIAEYFSKSASEEAVSELTEELMRSAECEKALLKQLDKLRSMYGRYDREAMKPRQHPLTT